MINIMRVQLIVVLLIQLCFLTTQRIKCEHPTRGITDSSFPTVEWLVFALLDSRIESV